MSGIVLAGVLAAMIIVFLYAREYFFKIVHAARTVQQIAHGNYSKRLNLKFGSELQIFVNSFNRMAKAVEEKIAQITKQSELMRKYAEHQKEFVANASHELRTPLAGMLLNAEAIARFSESKDEHWLAQHIIDQAKRASRTITCLLELANLENADESTLFAEKAELRAVLTEAAASTEELAERKNINIKIFDENMQPVIVPKCSELLFVNLIENAVKYSPENSEVKISITANKGGVTVYVRDLGPGIATEDIDRIFDRFFRTDKSRSTKTGGAGLGLALAKQVADLFGWKIAVHSVIGEGSEFTVIITGESNAQNIDC